ncbi:hypothetical protein BCT03_19420 [Vibrio splendidus]|nr:hypothetical protein [Vibrio splendidus]PMO71215.1 hypothetical protein BCT03_19420 [Vibrio splendidus]
MTSDQLLEKALYSSASIHQPHSLRAYLAANHLNDYFSITDNVWLKTSELIDQTEIEVLGECSATVQAPKFTDLPRKGERLPFVSRSLIATVNDTQT